MHHAFKATKLNKRQRRLSEEILLYCIVNSFSVGNKNSSDT